MNNLLFKQTRITDTLEEQTSHDSQMLNSNKTVIEISLWLNGVAPYLRVSSSLKEEFATNSNTMLLAELRYSVNVANSILTLGANACLHFLLS